MDTVPEFVVRAFMVGIGATLLTDLWAVAMQRAFAAKAPDWALVGRWVGHFARGRFTHDNIVAAPALRGERWLGWGFHYFTGIAYAVLLLAVGGPGWSRAPTLTPCVAIGLLTVVFPFFLMQPAMGAGVAASKAPKPAQARLRSLATHAVFGVGLYLAALLAAALLPS